MISPPWVVLKDRQTVMLTEFLTNRELPSIRATLTPPGCRLREPYIPEGKLASGPEQGGLLFLPYWHQLPL